MYFFVFHDSLSAESDEWANFGAYLGGILQFITVGGLLLTIYYQRKTLETNLEELQLSREELKGSREALEKQNQDTVRKTKIDIFFNLLKMHLGLLESFRKNLDGQLIHIFSHKYYESFNIAWVKDNSYKRTFDEEIEYLKDLETYFWQSVSLQGLTQSTLIYLNSIQGILHFLDRLENEETEPLIYILKMQFSPNEKLLLIYLLYFADTNKLTPDLCEIRRLLLKLKIIDLNIHESKMMIGRREGEERTRTDFHWEYFKKLTDHAS